MSECMNGVEHAIAEIDDEIRSHIPELKRRACTPRVMAEVDNLLDHRNLLVEMLGELSMDYYEELMTE